MNHYIYTDHVKHEVFECDALDIIEADTLYLNHSGNKKVPSEVTTWSPDWNGGNHE